MTDHTSLSSDLELLLSKDTLTEKDILDFPMFDITSCESPIPQLPLNQTILDATVTLRIALIHLFLTVVLKKRKHNTH